MKIAKTALVPSFCVESHQYVYHLICLEGYFHLIYNLSIFASAIYNFYDIINIYDVIFLIN